MAQTRLMCDAALADQVCEDVEQGLKGYLRIPTIRRYCAVVDPARHPLSAQEVAHQVLASCGAERAAVRALLANRYRAWRRPLLRAEVALDLFDAAAGHEPIPRLVGDPLSDGAPRFMIGERLSHGSGGAIYCCLDRVQPDGDVLPATSDLVEEQLSHSPLVVKLVRAPRGASEGAHAEAQRASRFGAQVGVRIVAWGDAGPGSGYIVMQRIEGLPLSAMAAAELGLDPAHASAEIARLALGLADLHGEGSGHGDITPMNVMVDATGSFRLIDFGHVGCASPEHDVRSLAALGLWISLGYLPPSGSTIPRPLPSSRQALAKASIAALNGSMDASRFAQLLMEQVRRSHTQRSVWIVIVGAGILAAMLYLAQQGVTTPHRPHADVAPSTSLVP